MPTMTTADLQAMTHAITSRDAKIEKANNKLEKVLVMNKFLVLGEAGLAAATFGFTRGWYEDQATGAWNIPHTTIDVELAAILLLVGVALLGVYYRPLVGYAQHAANAGAGILGHYTGQLARKAAKTRKATGKWGKFSLIAGVPGVGGIDGYPGIGELPQYDPNSYNPTQFSGVTDDAVAAALASSGV